MRGGWSVPSKCCAAVLAVRHGRCSFSVEPQLSAEEGAPGCYCSAASGAREVITSLSELVADSKHLQKYSYIEPFTERF